MIVVLSGEGPSDLGQCSNAQGQCNGPTFDPGPMTYLVDQVIADQLAHSLLETTPERYFFISETRLIELAQRRKENKRQLVIPGKKSGQGTAYYYTNAWALGEETLRLAADENDEAIGVLFRDSDGTRSTHPDLWQTKFDSMVNGFTRSGLKERGVPMLPRPKSEVWLLCAAKDQPYQHCAALENLSGNDDSPGSAKKCLSLALGGQSTARQQMQWLVDNGFDALAVANQMPSFGEFRSRLLAALTSVMH